MMKPPCLLFHGFTGGPYELQPLADYLQRRGTLCEVPRLPWHGEDRLDLKSSHWNDWVQAAENHAARMSENYGAFDLVGFSMGGLLASYIAVRYPIRKLVLLNASVLYVSPGGLLEDLRKRLKARIPLTFNKWRTTPLRATWQFTRLVKNMKPEISKIKIPTLICQSEWDQVVHPLSAVYIYSKLIGSSELRWYTKSNHLICLGEDAQRLFRDVTEFLDRD